MNDSPGVLVFPPFLFGGSFLLGLALHWLRPIRLMPVVPARVLGTILFLIGAVLARFAKRAMKRAGTNVHPDRPATVLVTGGPFRFTRNPLYLATIGLYLGVALLVDGLAPVVILIPALVLLHRGIVLREERYLEARFGEPYRAYRSRVRRWL